MHIGLTFTAKEDIHSGPGAAALAGNPFAAARDEQEEFDSPATINALADTIRGLGHQVELLGDGAAAMRRLLDGPRPDLVFNIAEGRGVGRGREARLPALLEMLGIPYTGSDPLTLAVALDKQCAKILAAAAGVATPAGVSLDPHGSAHAEALSAVPGPWIVKPACEGSSKGILACSLVDERDELRAIVAQAQAVYRQPLLVEQFIAGEELTVGLVGTGNGGRTPEVLGIMRVVPRQAEERFIYSLEVKRDWEARVTYEAPARLSATEDQAVRQAAIAVWQALGCRDVARIDFRLRDGVAWFIEANPLPGLSPVYSDLILLCRGYGIPYPTLIGRIIDSAVSRCGGAAAP